MEAMVIVAPGDGVFGLAMDAGGDVFIDGCCIMRRRDRGSSIEKRCQMRG